MTAKLALETIHFGSGGGGDPADNFDEWSRHSANHVLHRGGGHFRAEAWFWQLDRMVVTEQVLGHFTGERSTGRLAAVPTNQVTLIVVVTGSMAYRADEGEALAEAGDVVLLDFRRAYAFEVMPGRTITLSMDRGILEDETGTLTLAGRLPRTSETGMLAEFAATLVRHLAGMAMENVGYAAAALRRLIVMALRCGHPFVDPALKSDRMAALAYIERVPPGRLDVAAMVVDLGISRSMLYRLFRSEGGVLAYDRRRRLRLVHRSLCEDQSGTSLGDLGARHGFLDLSNLSRQFKAQFGLSMSQVRMHLLPRSAAADKVQRYRETIERFAAR